MPRWLRILLMVMIVVVFSVSFYLFFIRPYSFRWHLHMNRAPYYQKLPKGYRVCGMDISRYQGTIKWDKVAKYHDAEVPLEFVFVKATEGSNYVDDSFKRNFQEARKYGFTVGAYHYYIPQVDPVQQADFFIRTVKLKKGDLPPVLDVEKSGHLMRPIFQRDVKLWIDRIEKHYGIKPIIYTSYKFKKDYLDTDFFNRYPYWIAHYYVSSLTYTGEWSFWQYTDMGYIPEIKGDVDLNVFNGTLGELYEMTVK